MLDVEHVHADSNPAIALRAESKRTAAMFTWRRRVEPARCRLWNRTDGEASDDAYSLSGRGGGDCECKGGCSGQSDEVSARNRSHVVLVLNVIRSEEHTSELQS